MVAGQFGILSGVNETYLLQTIDFHEIGLLPAEAKHQINALDALGNEIFAPNTVA